MDGSAAADSRPGQSLIIPTHEQVTAEWCRKNNVIIGAMSVEGEADGFNAAGNKDVMTRENLIHEVGSAGPLIEDRRLRITIDHQNSPAASAYEGYNLSPQPDGTVGTVIAMGYRENGGGRMESIYAAIVDDPTYAAVDAGRTNGNSTETDLKGCVGPDGQCTIDRSRVHTNSIMIKMKPNYPGTYNRPVTQQDIDGGLVRDARNIRANAAGDVIMDTKIAKWVASEISRKNGMAAYADSEGKWIGGAAGIKSYLTQAARLGPEADGIAAYVAAHPDTVTPAVADAITRRNGWLEMWTQQRLNVQEDISVMTIRNNARMMWADPQAKRAAIAQARALVDDGTRRNDNGMTAEFLISRAAQLDTKQYGPADVSYTAQPATGRLNCAGCDHFAPFSLSDPDGIGMCQIVSGTIHGTHACSRHNAAEAAATGKPAVPQTEAPETEPSQAAEPKPEEKNEQQPAAAEEPKPKEPEEPPKKLPTGTPPAPKPISTGQQQNHEEIQKLKDRLVVVENEIAVRRNGSYPTMGEAEKATVEIRHYEIERDNLVQALKNEYAMTL